MRIYLDESKNIKHKKMVFGGFITVHSHSYVEKYMQRKKKEYGIRTDIELKGTVKLEKGFIKGL